MMAIVIREMHIGDYDAILAIWQATEHMTMNECDSRDGIALYLKRNPGLCFVALDGGRIIGTVLCGQDGRRGFLRHLAVVKGHRGGGISRHLVKHTLDGLAAQGIGKCNIFVENDNMAGYAYWHHLGWVRLDPTFGMLQTKTALA